MRKFRQVAKELESKPARTLVKLSFLFFLTSLLVGFSVGLVFREFRLNRLFAEQKNLGVQEDRQINSLFEKFSQNK